MKTSIIICLFALAVLIFFWDVIFGPDVLLDASPFFFYPWRSHASEAQLQHKTYRMDGLLTYLPRQVELSRSLRTGRFPLWNPYIYAGIPFFADPQARVVYPVSVLLAWMDPAKAVGYDIAIHFFIAMVGMYLFLRAVGTSTFGSIVGAIAYGFSSFFYCRLGQPTLIASAAWIPFFFYSYERAHRCERTGTLLLIVFLALGYLAGFPQIFMFGVGGLVIYAVTMNIDRRLSGKPAGWLRSLRILAVSGTCSALLVSVQLVPFLEFTRNATGLDIEFGKMRDVYLSPPVLLLKSIFPDFFGNPVQGTDWSGLLREAVHPYNPDFVIYSGIGCTLLAIGGLAFVRRVRRMRALTVLLLLSIGLATSPIMLRIAYSLLPVFRYSRVARVGVLGCFAVSALSALSISMLSRDTDDSMKRSFLRIVFVALTLILVGSVVFMAFGDSYIEKMAEKARWLSPEFWWSKLAQLRSGMLREWGDGNTAPWFAYERGELQKGMLFAALASIAIFVYAWPRRIKLNLRRVAMVVFVLILLIDIGLVSRGYFVTQPSGDFAEVDGISVLKAGLGRSGRWRSRSVGYDPEYVSTLPGNANQILKIHSLEGTATIIPEEYYSGLFASFRDSVIPARVRKEYVPLEPQEIRLSDLASVRYMAAEGTQAPYVSSPVFRTIIDGLAARGPYPKMVRLLSMGDDTRLALGQEPNKALTFALSLPGVTRLDFAVGFESEADAVGDSLTFLLTMAGPSNTVEFKQSFDLYSDGGRWHEVSLDISGIGEGPVKLMIGAISSRGEAAGSATGGWSGMDLVFHDCTVDTVVGGYRVHVGDLGEFASLELRSQAREIPLRISLGNEHRRIRWVSFPSHLAHRRLMVDLTEAATDTLLVESDSTFSLVRARVVHMGPVYADYELIHDTDMHIYENSAAVEKGICIDKTQVRQQASDAEPVLNVAGIDEIGAVGCGTCTVVSYEPERVVLDVSAHRACYLLFQDMYYPGWRAYVDKASSEFIKADVGFRVLEVPEGHHTIVMEFRPSSLKLGLAMTCLGIILTLVYAWKTRSHPGPEGFSSSTRQS
jgi:hypothetical protein